MSTKSPPGSRRLDQPIPEDIDRALDRLVRTSGVSKKALVADALRGYLIDRSVLPANTPPVQPRPTRGRLAASKRKEPQ